MPLRDWIHQEVSRANDENILNGTHKCERAESGQTQSVGKHNINVVGQVEFSVPAGSDSSPCPALDQTPAAVARPGRRGVLRAWGPPAPQREEGWAHPCLEEDREQRQASQDVAP